MGEVLYRVLVEREVVGKGMSLEYATLLAKGIFKKYHKEPELSVTIQREIIEDDF